jgi:hypothetical protein
MKPRKPIPRVLLLSAGVALVGLATAGIGSA